MSVYCSNIGTQKAWIINTNDTPNIYASLFQQDYGKVLKMCGIKTIKHSQLYFVHSLTKRKREIFIDKITTFSKTL